MERASVGRRAVLAGRGRGNTSRVRAGGGAGLGESCRRFRAVPLPRDGWDRVGQRQRGGGTCCDGGVHSVSGGAEPG